MRISIVTVLISFLFLQVNSNLLYAVKPFFEIKKLKVEYAETPLGIDVESPRFSWQMETPNHARGCSQAAYQIIVSDESGKQVWNTGKLKSDVSLNIEYRGMPLQPATRYEWIVKVWDQKNKLSSQKSWFETGLMGHGAYQGWSGAKWIGGGDDDMVLCAHYLPVFQLSFSLQLDKKSNTTRAGFVYGANDERLMDKNKNLYHLESKADESYVMMELDIAPLALGKEAQLNIYRAGYHPDDRKDVPYKKVSIPSTLINSENKYEKHTVGFSSDLGFTRIYIDNSEKELAAFNLNPLGQGGDFVAFPMVGDIGFFVFGDGIASFSDVEVRNFRSPSSVLFSEKKTDSNAQGLCIGLTSNVTLEKGAYRVNGGKNGCLLTATPGSNSMPMLRTIFSSSRSDVSKARLYVTARGIYEMYLNGKRIGDDYFNPGLTQYNKTHLYQTYDVTDNIQAGENALGALLAEGWWSGGATYMGGFWNFFGDRQSFLAKLVITYADGEEKTVVSDPSTWYYYNKGPVVYGSFFQGEVYDASKEHLVEGWSTASYDASGWKQAQEVSLEKNVSHAGDRDYPRVDDYSNFVLTGQFGQTVKAIKELSAISVEEARPGVFVYDMGQNMVGVPKIRLSGMQPGQRINLRFAEVKYPDLPEYADNVGLIMLENIRAAMAQDLYITKGGGEETISPRFTYHGYRFVEITGIDKPLPVEDVKGIVLSSIDGLSSLYETSNPKVNKLWENIIWSTYGNFLSIPTDCPQRNERLGWSGDISVFSRTATYLANLPQFLRRHMQAMRDVQCEDGRFTDVAPLGGGFGGVLWGSAGITVAWEAYQQYQDKRLLQEHYEAMKHYIRYLLDKAIDPHTNILIQEKIGWNLGDWLGPEDNKNDKSLLWEAYFLYDLELMNKIATVLNKKEDAEWYGRLYAERKAFFNATYIEPETGKTISSGWGGQKKGDPVDTQTSYVLPLAFDLVDQKNRGKVQESLKATLVRNNTTDNGTDCQPYSLMTGFIGTGWISKALSDSESNEEAYRLFQQTAYPSWLYSVEQGATTIWERLNSYTHVNGFGGNNRMNSFNHYSFGAVGAWMYNYSLGIQRDEQSPAFKHFLLKPIVDPTGEMTHAKGYYDSMYGRIESSWSMKNGSVYYDFVVPANTTALLYLPASSVEKIKESGRSVKKVKGVEYEGQKGGNVILRLQSGKYRFESDELPKKHSF